MTDTLLVAAGTFVVTVLGGLGVFWAILKKQRRIDQRVNQQRDIRLAEGLQKIVDWQATELRRKQKQLEAIYALAQLLDQDRGDCQVELTDLYGLYRQEHETLIRFAEALRRAQQDPGPVGPLAERPQRHNAAREFQRRTLEQNLTLLKELEKVGTEGSVDANPGGGQREGDDERPGGATERRRPPG